MLDLPRSLNPQQLDVVLHADGPCLVLAGAGSGKTRIITYRVAYLLEQGVEPDNILLLTFTNKAAAEMIGRVKELTGMEHKLPWAGTFHSIANNLLHYYASAIGYQSNFAILDEDDSQTLLKISLRKFKPDTDGRFVSARVLKSIVSYSRNAQTAMEEMLDLKYPQWLAWAENFKNIAADYERQKKQANAMDFDDLLVNFLLILDKPEIQKRLSGQFEYILVDEYQDTNLIQASIIRKLSLVHNNTLVVGDDAQSIYSFRAAEIKNILDFEKKYPSTKVFKLETNYRSSSEILDVANEVIANNSRQYKKVLRTTITSGIKPVLHPQMDQTHEAKFIVGRIKDKLAAGSPACEIAVLFRAAWHSQILEMELVKAGINYDYRGGPRFFERAHIKDVLAYLRVLNNLSDTPAWLRVLAQMDGIGPVVARRVLERVGQVDQIGQVGRIGHDMLSGKAKQGWHDFARLLEKLLKIDKGDVAALITSIKESHYSDYLEAEYADARERLQDIEQLAVFAASADNLDSFLAEASLQESFTVPNGFARPTVGVEQKIILSTVHQAKGLEWDSVFIINLAAGGFPSDYAFKERDGLEEERRLFYVAITRAKRHLYFTYPLAAGNWSRTGPSIFLEEIATDLLDDYSLLSNSNLVPDNNEEIKYISEIEVKPKIRKGGFLIDVD